MAINTARFRALVARVRPTASPLHTTRCTVRTRTWSGGEIGTGTTSDSDFLLGQEVRVSKLSNKDVLTSGGFFNFNDVKVEHITPPFSGGGYSLAQVAPSTQAPIPDGVEFIYLLSGEINGDYRLVNVSDDHALHYTLYLHELDVTSIAHAR